MAKYEPNLIEAKWNQKWYENNIYEAVDFDAKPKKYILAELPYPSGSGLHAGHMMRFTVPDVYSRYLRMRGFNVMFPMGWDAFGLPAENYAIKTGKHPKKLIQDTVVHYKESIRQMGYSVDWNREIDTTDPSYYKWTQWLFLKFYKAGLAEYKEMPIWWCETLKTVLSDEEVLTDKNGTKISERGEFPVEKKLIKQWVLKITDYADQLLSGLDTVDFPESIKSAQKNWIGRKAGIEIEYKIDGHSDLSVTCFTTRPETNFGATFIAISPEHLLVDTILTGKAELDSEIVNALQRYKDEAANKSDIERMSEGRKKTGVFTGLYAINNLNDKQLPIWVADFVLKDFGTGALVGVPGHDKRDFEFANQFDLEILRVVVGTDGNTSPITDIADVQEDAGTMINSKFLDGMEIHAAIAKMMDYLEQKGWGKKTKFYNIRDWVFSRQRYWGEPIPLVHKQNGKIEPICDPDDPAQVDKYLPLTLPELPDYSPSSDGASPLERDHEWVKAVDKDGNPAKRETNTMPNWAGSCWYYLRYVDPKNDTAFADPEKLKYWLPVDRYFGGAEHTTLHLLYSRFWHRFLYNQGLVPTAEPYAWRLNGGTLLGPDGKRMSKTRGNIVEPLALIHKFGADALRMFVCFLGPYVDTYPWNDSGVKATHRLIKNIYDIKDKVKIGASTDETTLKLFHKTIKTMSEMYEGLKVNTCVSELMILVNHLMTLNEIDEAIFSDLVKLLAPMAPFSAEDLWQDLHNYKTFEKKNSVHLQLWPTFDSKLAATKVSTIPVQINGKVRAEIEVSESDTEDTIKQKVLNLEKLAQYTNDKPIKKMVYVPGKIVNVVN